MFFFTSLPKTLTILLKALAEILELFIIFNLLLVLFPGHSTLSDTLLIFNNHWLNKEKLDLNYLEM